MTMLCAPKRIAPPIALMTGHLYCGYGLRDVEEVEGGKER
jgi:hypothetical protein